MPGPIRRLRATGAYVANAEVGGVTITPAHDGLFVMTLSFTGAAAPPTLFKRIGGVNVAMNSAVTLLNSQEYTFEFLAAPEDPFTFRLDQNLTFVQFIVGEFKDR